MPRKNPTKVSGNYASGISLPFRPDGDGGVALAEGDPYIRGQVVATVSQNDSENPFQDLGGTESPVFQNPDDVEWRRVVRRRIERQFNELDTHALARLKRLRFRRGEADGELTVDLEYINLESTLNQDVTVGLRASDTLGTASAIPGLTRSG